MIFGFKGTKGIHNLLIECIDKLDVNVRGDVLNNIILTGGTTNTRMFFERLQKELYESNKNDLFYNYKTKFHFCSNKNDKRNSSWVAASIIGTMKKFKDLSILREDYLEHGFSLIDRKIS